MDSNRRQFYRVLVRLPVDCRRLGAGDGTIDAFAAETVDLSAGGMRIMTGNALAIGDPLQLEMRFGQPEVALTVRARVVRIETTSDGRSLCALTFERLDPAAESRVVRAVFAEERRAAEARSRMRLSLWLPVTCRLPRSRDPIRARTIDLSSEELRLVTRARLSIGDRVDLEIAGGADGFGLATSAVVADVDEGSEGRLIATLRFADADRAVRASILRFALEAERRQAPATPDQAGDRPI
jgi:c-di-GMP-binding flagellar brake protein YcgR